MRRLLTALTCLLVTALVTALVTGLVAGSATSAQAFSLIPGENVTTRSGVVQGSVQLDHREFLGIPYAAPPTGARRFAPPALPASWPGERPARQRGPACPQNSLVSGSEDGKEDCLNLNVLTPPLGATHLPVMVWIHGGGYVIGSTAEYDLTPLVTSGRVIVVEIEYRVGPFGFLTLPGLAGNAGLLDQQAGLRWVRENIAAFGGDAANVTVFGESAGGNSVCQQLASPTARGLFDRAIVQSGGCGSTTLDARPRATAEAGGSSYAAALGCSDPATALECLRAATVEDLLKSPTTQFSSLDVSWQPTVDGTVVTAPSDVNLAAGRFARVPVLIGGQHDEARLFVALFYHLKQLRPITAAEYATAIRSTFGSRADAVLAAYPVSAFASPDLALAAAQTDGLFACETSAAITSLSRAAPVTYAYEFADAKPPLADLDPYLPLGSYHGAELWFLFARSAGLPRPLLNERQSALSRQMIGYWTAFARTGDPNGAGRPSWPAAGGGQLLTLNTTGSRPSSLTAFAAEHHCDFWAG